MMQCTDAARANGPQQPPAAAQECSSTPVCCWCAAHGAGGTVRQRLTNQCGEVYHARPNANTVPGNAHSAAHGHGQQETSSQHSC